MARTKENVQDFIETVRSEIKPVHDENIQQLTAYAQERSKQPKEYEQLQSYDVAYWRQRQVQDLQSALKIDASQISRHFTYEHVLQGLFRFTEHLFGVQFVLDNEFDDEFKWHPDAKAYRCVENGELPIRC